MAASMKSVTESGLELSNEERNLLSVAYKVCPAHCATKIRSVGLTILFLERGRCQAKLLEGDF